MNEFTNEEKLGLLKRGLERRLIGVNPAIEEKEKQIEQINEIRQSYVDVLEEHKDNELIVRVFKAQLTEFDRQYSGTKQNYVNAIEEIKEAQPLVEIALDNIAEIENGTQDGDFMYTLLDLFFKPLLTDWYEMEQNMKEKEDNDTE